VTPAIKAKIDERVAELLATAPPIPSDKITALASVIVAARRATRSAS
jgi:hypothetical protein